MTHQTSNTDLRGKLINLAVDHHIVIKELQSEYFNEMMALIEADKAAAYKQGVTDCNTWDTWKLHANNIDTDKLDQELKNKIAAAVQAALRTIHKTIVDTGVTGPVKWQVEDMQAQLQTKGGTR